MTNLYIYKGMMVEARPYPHDKFYTLVLDAKRIMGLAPSYCDRITLLEPPPENSDVWNYAKHILDLKWPVVEIWIGYPLIVSESDLQRIE